MQAKLLNHVVPHWYPLLNFEKNNNRLECTHFERWCFSNWDEWFRLWLPIQELLAQDCWFDNLRVIYNESTNEYDSPIGVTVDTIDFGGTSGNNHFYF